MARKSFKNSQKSFLLAVFILTLCGGRLRGLRTPVPWQPRQQSTVSQISVHSRPLPAFCTPQPSAVCFRSEAKDLMHPQKTAGHQKGWTRQHRSPIVHRMKYQFRHSMICHSHLCLPELEKRGLARPSMPGTPRTYLSKAGHHTFCCAVRKVNQ